MNKAVISYILGWIVLCETALMVLPLGVSLIYGEESSIMAFAITIFIAAALGALLTLKKPKNRMLRAREGFVATALSWIVISIIGAVPFVISGSIKDPILALFESVSGFTTTGASVISDVEVLDKGILFWRSFTHWIGGMGVLVFILMLKPLTGASTLNLMKAESPGPQVEKLVPKLQSTAQILYAIYIALTIAEMVILYFAGMPIFDAVTTAFGTAGTGGFGIKNDSIAGYSHLIQYIVAVFMILFGVNFSSYFLILRGKLKKSLTQEVKWYFLIIAVSVFIIVLNIQPIYGNIGESFRHTLFQVGSIITTTGYATDDFNLWPATAKTILVLLMFIGACAGSTGGGIKVSRFVILLKSIKKEIHHYIHPNRVEKISIDAKGVPHEVVRATNVFMITYLIIFAASVFLISFDNLDMTTNFTAIVATFNNIGPGLELVGPTQNFGVFSSFSKLVLIFDMLAGRLELFPILLLLYRRTWQKF